MESSAEPYTHVCGILAGNGKLSDGRYRGIAPGCNILCGKVLDEKGAGSLKNLLAGLQWVMELLDSYPIRILNISIEMEQTSALNPDEVELLRKFLHYFWESNIVTVAAAGNKGPDPMSISPISESSYCICVGCNDGDYVGIGGRTCAEYSARGPASPNHLEGGGNPLKKPDIVAPGTDIISCCNRVYWKPPLWRQAYTAKSGTSMATPLVSGACALCMQKYPKITNTQLRRLLFHSARDLGENWNTQGAGMMQVDKMLENLTKKYI